MNKQTFKKWDPVAGLPEKMYLEGLHDDYEGFRLLLRGEGEQAKSLRILFDSVLAYRNVDEGDLLKTLHQSTGLVGWALYTVENSEYLKWFNDESQDVHGHEKIVHYAVYTPNDCIDILAATPPRIDWLN